jgi:lipopolysaccharide biosynthesis glycosyltransferase
MQKETYIWGAGHYGVLTALRLENEGVKINGFIDKNAKEIKTRLGLPVLELNETNNKDIQIIIAIQNKAAMNEIIGILLSAGLKKNIDFKISPLIPAPHDYFSSVEEEIAYYRNALKERKDIYFHEEETAKNLADAWNGVIDKPKKLRFIENAIPIVLCANEKFAPYLAVMLQSLLDNSNYQRNYHFIILERGFSKKSKDYLVAQISKFPHCYIDFINTASAFDKIPIASSKKLSIDTFSRLFIPYWLDEYRKVIYLDSDMLAKADIAKLYDIDISGFCMGAAQCQVADWSMKHRDYNFVGTSAAFMFIENWRSYINAGVLVFDTQKFKEKISYKDLFKFAIYFSNRYRVMYDDQDVLALLVKEDYFVLPPEWNYFWTFPWIASKLGYRIAEPNTKIIHFLTNIKPWRNESEIEEHPAALDYRNYAMKVPLYRDSLANEH